MAINAQVPDPAGEFQRDIADMQRAIRENQASIAQTVAPMVAQGNAQMQAFLAANYWTQAQTGQQIASAVANPGAISPTTVQASGAVSAPSFSATGAVSAASVTASGSVVGNTGQFNGGLVSTSVYSTNITGTRSATWTGNNGQMGTASSSEKTKTNIVDSLLATPARAQAALGLAVVHYNYIAELAKRDDPTSPDYVGPDYQVHTELGLTAESVHAAGLWELVVYQRTTVTQLDTAADGSFVTVIVGDELAHDADGNPIPIGLHYELFGVVALAAAQYLNSRVTALEQAVAALTPTATTGEASTS